jgi:hypothetical protein
MQAVYSNAACTIAATAAEDSSQGLFFDRNPWLVRPRRFTSTWAPEQEPGVGCDLPAGEYWCDYDDLWRRSIEDAPLNRRGWVFQERHLSRRIMHFAAAQLFWECCECKSSENYPISVPVWMTEVFALGSDPTPLKQRIHKLRKRKVSSLADATLAGQLHETNTRELEDLYLDWIQWRFRYSTSIVTKDEDKLVALQGIAQDVGQFFDDKLVAGMWKGRILQELCFKYLGSRMNTSYRRLPAPSWSWASTNQSVMAGPSFRLNRKGTYIPKVGSLDVPNASFEASRRATLRIQCNLIHAICKWDVRYRSLLSAPSAESTGDLPLVLRALKLIKSGVHVDFEKYELWDQEALDDYWVLSDSEDCRPEIHLLVVKHFPLLSDGEVQDETVAVLLLARQPESEQAYKRIGFFEWKGDNCRQLIAEHDMSENQIITLV